MSSMRGQQIECMMKVKKKDGFLGEMYSVGADVDDRLWDEAGNKRNLRRHKLSRHQRPDFLTAPNPHTLKQAAPAALLPTSSLRPNTFVPPSRKG